MNNTSLEARCGEITAIVGENGSGKSTLMEIAAGALYADTGSMDLFGTPYSPKNPLHARQSGVVMVHQNLSLAPHMTVAENLFLGVEPNKWGWLKKDEQERLAVQTLSSFTRTNIDVHETVEKLSVGTQQMVEIARAISSSARVLILDEPTSSLSLEDTKLLFSTLKELKDRGLAIIYITHFLEEVKEISDRLVILRDGNVVGAGKTNDFSIAQMISLMIGRTLSHFYHRHSRTQGEVILDANELQGLNKPISASFSLYRGEVLGIAGLRDSGRTELLRCLFGLDAIRKGEVRIGGYLGQFSPEKSWKNGMGMMPEDRIGDGIALELGIHDNITLTRIPHNRLGFFFLSNQIKVTQNWMNFLDIRHKDPCAPISVLSGGNQQKAVLARLLHHDVDILLMDEPTKGIDIGAKETIYRLIHELAAGSSSRAPKAVLIVSSYLPELLGICDRIAVMNRGYLGVPHKVSEVDEHSLMSEAVRGLH